MFEFCDISCNIFWTICQDNSFYFGVTHTCYRFNCFMGITKYVEKVLKNTVSASKRYMTVYARVYHFYIKNIFKCMNVHPRYLCSCFNELLEIRQRKIGITYQLYTYLVLNFRIFFICTYVYVQFYSIYIVSIYNIYCISLLYVCQLYILNIYWL